MTFDKKFEGLSKLVKVILLIIPFVGWIVEILVRLSALLRKSSTLNIVGFVLYLVGGVIFAYVDLFFVIFTNKQFLLE